MRLVDFVQKETGVGFEEIFLLRHVDALAKLEELGGSIEDFSFVQLKGTKQDFGKYEPPIRVVVVVLRNQVFGVYRILDMKEGRFSALASKPHQEYDNNHRNPTLNDPNRPTRRFEHERVPCAVDDKPITGWKGREINGAVRGHTNTAQKIEVNLRDATMRLTGQ